MDIAPDNLIYHELIGLHVEVTESSQYSLSGRIVDETKNMLVIRSDDRDLMIPKSCCAFIFTLPDGKRVKVQGTLLQSQPENRIPKKRKR